MTLLRRRRPLRRHDLSPHGPHRAGRPVVSLGLWCNVGDDVPLDRQRDVLRRALDLGITHVDLADDRGPPYGPARHAVDAGTDLRRGSPDGVTQPPIPASSQPSPRSKVPDRPALRSPGSAPSMPGCTSKAAKPIV